ncbi:DUF2933 domain-containing protein [Neorhizobium galegae]|uniref:DUF2933 domain-containing protein n=1 Tax=Neorhizobium galegae bv. officinalis TaxID=323656 RepID=A0A0T7GJV7_NEOGA|nr:DUF2933 domain-containing protein [Neorhizobium galegae]CDZ47554.1 Hypothetical protein NGAL_HAMBI1189_19990 [Neorhizobium galegae bv. officinalis]
MSLSRTWLLIGASLTVIAVFFMLREHWAHALGMSPYLLLLACPLLHLFHGHGGHTGGKK